MRPLTTEITVNTVLVVIALVLALLALTGVFSPLALIEIAVICLAIAMLI